MDIYFQTLWKHETKKHVSIVVGGGGASGVEFAGELCGFVKQLCAKYKYPIEDVSIDVIEASEKLASQDAAATASIEKRLKEHGVCVNLRTKIREVHPEHIVVEHADATIADMPMDILIWTGGVRAHPLIGETFEKCSPNGAVMVNKYLQTEEDSYVFAAGDNSCFIDPKTDKPIPWLAQIANRQGKTVAHNIIAQLGKGEMKVFTPHIKGVVIPLAGKYAIFSTGSRVWHGWHWWIIRRCIDLSYAMSILPFWHAIKKWIHDTNIFVKNDSNKTTNIPKNRGARLSSRGPNERS